MTGTRPACVRDDVAAGHGPPSARRSWLLALVVAAAIVTNACAPEGEVPTPRGLSVPGLPFGRGVYGLVMGIPSCSAQRSPCPVREFPLPDQEVTLLAADGATAARTTSSPQGQFAISGNPGTYRVVVHPAPVLGFAVERCTARRVVVRGGAPTFTFVRCDLTRG